VVEKLKTIEEVKERIDKHLEDDTERLFIEMCGGVHPLMDFVPEYWKEEYKPQVKPLSEEAVIKEMVDYLEFAFGKANGKRGISSERSIWRYQQWLWALEDHELLAFALDKGNYPMYGLPILEKIKEKYGNAENLGR